MPQNTDPFSIRSYEILTYYDDHTDEEYAVKLVPVTLPKPSHNTTYYGAPVENCAVIAATFVNGAWQWMQLSPYTKEHIGRDMFKGEFEINKWYFLEVK